jgi:hypothetical protein
MNKVWLHTYWMSWGLVVPATATSSGRQPRMQKAWMRSINPPYYNGVGLAVRIGGNTLMVGVCHPMGRLTRPDTNAEIFEALFGRPVDKSQEGQWGSEERSA